MKPSDINLYKVKNRFRNIKEINREIDEVIELKNDYILPIKKRKSNSDLDCVYKKKRS